MAEVSSYAADMRRVATSDSLPWDLLEGCNVLVTGATGLIGSCVTEILLQHNGHFHVYAAGRNEQRARQRFARYWDDERFHFVNFDVMNPLQGDTLYHYIIHTASGADPRSFNNWPVEVMKANLLGVMNLMDYGRAHDLKRLLFVSSGEVYGQSKTAHFVETDSGYVDCATPRACYPSAKRAAETLCVCYQHEYAVDTVIARLCHTYGPGFTESDNRVYAQFIRNVLRGEDIVMKSEGKPYRSWCYVVDAASALLHILLKGNSGEAYNVADESSNITIRELAEMTAELAGRKVVIELPPDAARQNETKITRAVFDTTKLQGLGWHVEGCMKDKLRRTIEAVSEREGADNRV